MEDLALNEHADDSNENTDDDSNSINETDSDDYSSNYNLDGYKNNLKKELLTSLFEEASKKIENRISEMQEIFYKALINAGYLKMTKKKYKVNFSDNTSINVELIFQKKDTKKKVQKEPITEYGLILKDQPKPLQTLMCALGIPEGYIKNVFLYKWYKPSDIYRESNSVECLKSSNTKSSNSIIVNNLDKILHLIETRISDKLENEILDIPKQLLFASIFLKYYFDFCIFDDQFYKHDGIEPLLKELKFRQNEMMTIFNTIKMIPNLLAYKVFPIDQGTFPERQAKQNAKTNVLRYLKESLNLFLYCITFGLVFSMGDPLGGTKDWKNLNEDDYKNSVKVLNESEELKSALQERNAIFGPIIMNALVDYAEKYQLIKASQKNNLDQTDLAYLLRGVNRNYQYWDMRNEDDFLNENPQVYTPAKFTFFEKKFEALSLNEMARSDNNDEFYEEVYNKFNDDNNIYENDNNFHEDKYNEMEVDNFNNRKKILDRRNLTGATNLTEYTKWLTELQNNDLKDAQFRKFDKQIDKLLTNINSIKGIKGNSNNALQVLITQVLKFSGKLFIHFSEVWCKEINSGLFHNTIQFFDQDTGNDILWYSEFRKIIDEDIKTSYNYLNALKLKSMNDFEQNQYETIMNMIDIFELEFNQSDQLSRAVIISKHAITINKTAEEFLKKYSDYFIECIQNLPESYSVEKVTIQNFVQDYFSNDDKLSLFINIPENRTKYENLVKNKIVDLSEEFTRKWNEFLQENESNEAKEFTRVYQEFVNSLHETQKPYYLVANELDGLIRRGEDFLSLEIKSEPIYT
ncbi:21533_t:CDS:2 [Dentiscutata erythropus]|uniref:21533_t:CDS:1 n=1 Tax=Dentiscutata erythropus TaxID=1348616 RepID=A0A9N9CLE9_9GLOM|nr:21533_t:CDS:2 [Dentiscutata erythropus]